MSEVTSSHLSLLTLNGRITNPKTKLKVLEEVKKENYSIKKVKNFYLLKFNKLGICISLYSKGGFKVTISRENGCIEVIKRVNHYLEKVMDIVNILYTEGIRGYELSITQVSVIIKPEEKKHLTYSTLIKQLKQNNNELRWSCKDYTLTHTINWMGLESGLSSFYFQIRDNEEGKYKGGIKIFNNFKVVLMLKEILIIPEFINIIQNFTLSLQ